MAGVNQIAEDVGEAAALGRTTLSGLVRGMTAGVTVIDDGHVVYANPAACELLGCSPLDLQGRAVSDCVPADELPDLLPRLVPRPTADADTFRSVLLDADGGEVDVLVSTFTAQHEGRDVVVATFRRRDGPRNTARTAGGLARTAARLVTAQVTLNEIVADIARYAFEGSRAQSAGIVVMGSDHRLDAGGGYGGDGANFGDASRAWAALNEWPGEDVISALGAGRIVVGERPGPPVVLPDARSMWSASPVLHSFAATMDGADWRGAVCVPLSWDGEVIGVLGVYFPAQVAGPTDDELAFFAVLADQAAMAVSTVRLTDAAGRGAALQERARLARELHDSISQGLFAMTMQARAAQLSTTRSDLPVGGPLNRSITALADLSRSALADMRVLIFELRPGALAEEGLIGALRKQVAALSAREDVAITLDSALDRLVLPAVIEEHVYRIVCEALHNMVKHAGAQFGRVAVSLSGRSLRVTVSDDGVGFDTSAGHPGHLGLSSMRERARTIGAEIAIESSIGSGTVLTLTMPIPERRQPVRTDG